MEVIERAQRIAFGDSFIYQINIDLVLQKCSLVFQALALFRDIPDASMSDPELRYEPAVLELEGVDSVVFPDGAYYLNQTIIGFEVEQVESSELVRFYFRMTGSGWDERFICSLEIVARDFSLKSAPEVNYYQDQEPAE